MIVVSRLDSMELREVRFIHGAKCIQGSAENELWFRGGRFQYQYRWGQRNLEENMGSECAVQCQDFCMEGCPKWNAHKGKQML